MRQDRKSALQRFSMVGGIAVIGIIALFTARGLFGFGIMNSQGDWPTRFQSNGERIYFTGASASGSRILPRGGGMHMSMMGGGCVTCHGVNRQGGRAMPRFWKVVPPLTPAALFGAHDADEKDDGHGDHDFYTDETLRRAITKGLDPAGQPLGPEMPRWSLSRADLDDLIAHLKTPVAPQAP